MALDTTTLKNTLKAAFLTNLPSPSSAQVAEVDALANSIANAMQVFVTGATVSYTSGLVAPGGGGPVTGVFINTIS